MDKKRRTPSPQRRPHSFRIACAWCKRGIGWKRKEVAVPGETTYGICPPCVAEMISKLTR